MGVMAVLCTLTSATGCGSSDATVARSAPAATPAAPPPSASAAATPTETAAPAADVTSGATTAESVAVTDAASDTSTVSTDIVNVWSGAVVDPTKLPIGDDLVSTDGAAVGGLFACSAGNANAGGASADGPWLNIADGTWDMTTKLAVEGSVLWEAASFTETIDGDVRTIVTNSVPVEDPTGTFPIAASDPSYDYDRNPGTITPNSVSISLPRLGTLADAPSCMNEGQVGIMRNGVFVFNSLDGRGDDAVAHESQDLCNGHPAMTTYHYHNVPNCLRDKATGSSTVVGYAYDGFPIVVERDAAGELPTNADLDECHGRTSPVLLDGEVVETYHYSATLEFPYFIGCFMGTKIN
jgi:hypothetical protein